ncbi:ABC transporter ATP-binding protein/permease [Peristeroidobacter soli]|uniref:ABC transporter ATP-binding protein/permease n=1 Tax=Peristeroidobacter soli TaxID=2497877 RepID=UPI00101B6EBF|nr:ATP-binding cassette domain-containing protein [Peristeroidobacter soli]
MTDARTIQVDPRDYRLDGRLFRRIWRLAKPYWSDPKHWKSWVLMIFGILIGPAWAYYSFWAAQVGAEQANALVSKNPEEWHRIFWLLFLLGIGRWLYGLIIDLLNTLMQMQWYRWMTQWVVKRYLSHKTYYDIAMRDDVDNPDERIQDNVLPFIDVVLNLPLKVLGTILGLTTNVVLLSQVNSSMTTFVVVYSSISMIVQTVIYWPLIRKNFDAVAAAADFRFGLLRVRDNAETIAFFRGENMEENQVSGRLDRVIRNKMNIYYYNLKTGFITKFLGEVWTVAPLVLIYPLYFGGEIQYGTIALAMTAADGLRSALMSLDSYIPLFAGIAPRVVRLAQIVERFDAMDAQVARHSEQITIKRGDFIELEHVCFQTPGGEQQLAQDVSLTLRPGESMIIVGQTGVGKSSMLRSMAGLWVRGTGTMTMPSEDDTMFVPQKPYMMLGNLRAQLLYPHGRSDMTDEEMQAVLEKVCLPNLIEKAGGLDADRDWSKVLSLGEQQRVSFARILISRPKYVFLDESTSAVDIPTEARLYKALIETGATFISVGHRETILRFHDRALRLLVGGGWEIIDSRSIEPTLVQPLGASRATAQPESVAPAEPGASSVTSCG